ncbi:DUF3179 domain-containing protein [Rhodoferax sp.]|uniref:DUF3179 domain-containing protein n=1 Tax=Rhodoferax sp. TaxID=50421 RepID=UPI00260F429C|nr:DUF3179 domain-containing protein [Rhodoferax sp.]MDD2919513.1 DUF3179 domain-containing protein [Rhodoferax sp.]
MLSAWLVSSTLHAQVMNGVDLKDPLIAPDQIVSGGPAKDGIPAIDRPRFISAKEAGFLQANDMVLGLAHQGVARAYPLRILNWHEVVNDQFGAEPITITYCPLCGTGMVFERRVKGRVLSFGVSGLLYNNDVLLYDRETGSLWSQLLAQAISGPLKGQRLAPLPVTHTNWSDWRASHATTQVLSTDTGNSRSYDRDPYAGYDSSTQIMFPLAFRSAGFHPKERVLGVQIGTATKAYPFVELGKTNGLVTDQLAGTRLTIRFDRAASRATVHAADGRKLPGVVAYWFAWYTFHPDTAVFHAAQH